MFNKSVSSKTINPNRRASDENRRKERELRKKLLEKKRSSSRETSECVERSKGGLIAGKGDSIKKSQNSSKQVGHGNEVEPGEIIEQSSSRLKRSKFIRKKRFIQIKENQETKGIRAKIKFKVIRTKPTKTLSNISSKERGTTNGKKQNSASSRSFSSSTSNIVANSSLPPLSRKNLSSSSVSTSSSSSARSPSSKGSGKHRFTITTSKPINTAIKQKQRSISPLPKSSAHKRIKPNKEISSNIGSFLLPKGGSSSRVTSKKKIPTRRVVISSSKPNNTKRLSHQSNNSNISDRDDRINHDRLVIRTGSSTSINHTNLIEKASLDKYVGVRKVKEKPGSKTRDPRNRRSPGRQEGSHDRKFKLRTDSYGRAKPSAPNSNSSSEAADSTRSSSSLLYSFNMRKILKSGTKSGTRDSVLVNKIETTVSKKRVRKRPPRRSPSISGARSINGTPSDKSIRSFSSSSGEENAHRSRMFSSSSSRSRPKKRRRKKYRRSRSRTRSPISAFEKQPILSHSREHPENVDFFKNNNSIKAKRTSKNYSIAESSKETNTSGARLKKSEGSEKAQADLLKLKNLIIESEKNPVSSGELSGSIKMSRSSSSSKIVICKEDRISGEIENNARRRSNSSPTITYSPAFTPTVNKPPRAPKKRDSPRTPICCNLEDSELMLEVTGNDISLLRAQSESVSDQKKQSERRKRMLEWKKRKRGVLTKDDQKKRKLNNSEPCTISKSSSAQPTADMSAISNDALEFDFSGGEDIEGAVHDKSCPPASDSMISTSDDTGGKQKKDSEDEITADEWDVSKYGCRRLEPHYTIKNLLDSGTYGTVFRAISNRTGEIFALKKIKMQQSKDGFPITSLRELALLMEIDHQNVVKAIEIVVSKRNIRDIFMVMEFCDHDFGALLKIKKQPFALSELKCLMQQLLSGLSYMHANWMLHRDLKPSNLLLNSKGILKICDFGMARRYGSPIEPYTPNCCTLWYQSPEMLMGVKTYTTAVDCWSVGVIMAQLVLGRPLFKGGTAFAQLKEILKILGTPDESTPGWNGLEEVKKWKFKFYTPRLRSLFMPKGPTLTQSCRLSSEGFNCLNKLLQWDPTFRLTASEALKHDWFVETPRPCTPDLLPTFPKLNEQKRSRAIRQYKSDMKLKEQMLREKGGFHMGV